MESRWVASTHLDLLFYQLVSKAWIDQSEGATFISPAGPTYPPNGVLNWPPSGRKLFIRDENEPGLHNMRKYDQKVKYLVLIKI
jgi:hypothetical protein